MNWLWGSGLPIGIDYFGLVICEYIKHPYDSYMTCKYLKQNIAAVLKGEIAALERPEADPIKIHCRAANLTFTSINYQR